MLLLLSTTVLYDTTSHHICCFSKEKLPNVLIPPKVLELERERALKWGKMLNNWKKFQGSDVVSIYSNIYQDLQ